MRFSKCEFLDKLRISGSMENFCPSVRSQLFIYKITAIDNKVDYLHSNFVVSVSLIADAVCNGVDYVNLQKVCRSGVCIVQGLFLAGQPFGGIFAGHFSGKA